MQDQPSIRLELLLRLGFCLGQCGRRIRDRAKGARQCQVHGCLGSTAEQRLSVHKPKHRGVVYTFSVWTSRKLELLILGGTKLHRGSRQGDVPAPQIRPFHMNESNSGSQACGYASFPLCCCWRRSGGNVPFATITGAVSWSTWAVRVMN